MANNQCETDECGCKTNADTVVYIGPTLTCTGITNCDTVPEAIVKINELLCSDAFIQTIITNIINNATLLEQFTTIVNNSLSCETVQECLLVTTTTTTTIV